MLTLDSGRTLRTDLLFFATGRAPATKGLGLDKIGVTLNDAGAVVIDQNLRTSQPHIYAMGDVTDRLNLTPVAIAEGHALADSLFGKERTWHLAAQRADSGVLHAADRDLRAHRGAGGGTRPGRCLCQQVHADAPHPVGPCAHGAC